MTDFEIEKPTWSRSLEHVAPNALGIDLTPFEKNNYYAHE
jgi:hypothetical protein